MEITTQTVRSRLLCWLQCYDMLFVTLFSCLIKARENFCLRGSIKRLLLRPLSGTDRIPVARDYYA